MDFLTKDTEQSLVISEKLQFIQNYAFSLYIKNYVYKSLGSGSGSGSGSELYDIEKGISGNSSLSKMKQLNIDWRSQLSNQSPTIKTFTIPGCTGTFIKYDDDNNFIKDTTTHINLTNEFKKL